jgi:hypothetical protein
MLSDQAGTAVHSPLTEPFVVGRAETMLALADFIGVDLDEMNEVRIRLEAHEAMFDAAPGPSRRADLERLMAVDIAELAAAFKIMARAVERGGTA